MIQTTNAMKHIVRATFGALFCLFSASAMASEADLVIPSLNVMFNVLGMEVSGVTLMGWGMVVAVLGMVFGVVEFMRIKKLPAHRSLLDISALIYETCKTYLLQQGKFLAVLELFIGGCIFYYFFYLQHMELSRVLLILFWSVMGILGSFGVAWFGIRINNYANSRTAFASLAGKPYPVMDIPLRSGMSIGVLLICVELLMMIFILLFMPPESAGACFIGFAIGESLGASALRICGGIFTKIADIGSDLMKIVFNIKEDDARNPGVIADCTGDNAGDSVGPTADGFETYGVTGVALISFIVLAVGMGVGFDGKLALGPGGGELQAKLIVWIFVMRFLMILTSIFSYWFNNFVSRARYASKDHFDFEAPLTSLVWITSLVSILVTYAVSWALIADLGEGLWWKLSTIISCGTIAAAVIPELTKIFTSAKSKHVAEVVAASREGGASLTILSGLVAGNFSAFWKGMTIVGLMLIAYLTAQTGLDQFMVYPAVFAFGLVAFGFLGMGPVTIAVDSYGPVTDNAQSVFELSQIESDPKAVSEVEKQFGFKPNFTQGKLYLEENDSAGNTFKATAKPVLIGTAVIGATTMIFSIILLMNLKLDLMDPRVLLGLITGGAVIYWFTGASIQAVTTGAYRAVEYIKQNIRLDSGDRASVESSKEVVKICTQYAPESQKRLIRQMASEIQDFPRHLSIHSGGFTLSADPIIETVPVEPARMEGRTIIQWDKYDLDIVGLLKVDVLALGMLTAIKKMLVLTQTPNLASVPHEDPATYEMIRRSDTVGVFQIESRAQMNMTGRLQPRDFYDLVIQIALVRPGPITGKMVHPYLRRRYGLDPVEIPHPKLEAILRKTLGIPIFQEQVMKIAIELAGFTPGEADELRRAIGAWRSSGSIEKVGRRLMNGLLESGLSPEFAERIFLQIRGFAEYGFPESHSASFALLAYVSAYFKCHHPAEFACAMVNSQPMGFYATHTLIDDAKRHNIIILPLHPNHSAWDCTIVAHPENSSRAIRLGWRVVRGISEAEAKSITENQPFQNLFDFLARTELRQDTLYRLALGDVFRCFGLDQRHSLWQVLYFRKFHQLELFSQLEEPEIELLFQALEPIETLQTEYQCFGLSPRAHIMHYLRSELRSLPRATSQTLREMNHGQKIRTSGFLIVLQRPGTAKGTVFGTLEDEFGFIDLVFREPVFLEHKFTLYDHSFFIIEGIAQREQFSFSILVQKITPIQSSELAKFKKSQSSGNSYYLRWS